MDTEIMETEANKWLYEALDMSCVTSYKAVCLVGSVGDGKSAVADDFIQALFNGKAAFKGGVFRVDLRGIHGMHEMVACLGAALDMSGQDIRNPSLVVRMLLEAASRCQDCGGCLLVMLDNIDDVLVGPAYHVFMDMLITLCTRHTLPVKLLLTCRGDASAVHNDELVVYPEICLEGLVFKPSVDIDRDVFSGLVKAYADMQGLASGADEIAAACNRNLLLAKLAVDAIASDRVTLQTLTQAAAAVVIPKVTADGKTHVRNSAMQWLLGVVRQHAAVAEALCGPGDPLTLAFMVDMGATLMRLSQKDVGSCVKLLRMVEQAHDRHIGVLGEDHPLSIQVSLLLADCLTELGRHSEAEAWLRRVATVAARVLGSDHPSAVTAAINLSHCLSRQCKHEDAVQVYGTAIRGVEGANPWVAHPGLYRWRGRCVSCLLALLSLEMASTLMHMRDYAAAEAALRACERIDHILRQEFSGPTVHAMLTFTLVASLMQQGRQAEGLETCRQALQLPVMQDVTHNKRLFDVVVAIASRLSCKAGYAAADMMYEHLARPGCIRWSESMYRNVVQLKTRLLGRDHSETVGAMSDLAGCLSQLKQYDEACTLYDQILEVLSDTDRVQDIFVTTQCLAGCHMQRGRWQQARLWYGKAVALAKRTPGLDSPWTATVGLCKCMQHDKQYKTAEALYREVQESIAQEVGPESADCISSRWGMTLTMFEQGKVEEAERECGVVLELSTRVLGPSHVFTLRAGELLIKCQAKMADGPGRKTDGPGRKTDGPVRKKAPGAVVVTAPSNEAADAMMHQLLEEEQRALEKALLKQSKKAKKVLRRKGNAATVVAKVVAKVAERQETEDAVAVPKEEAAAVPQKEEDETAAVPQEEAAEVPQKDEAAAMPQEEAAEVLPQEEEEEEDDERLDMGKECTICMERPREAGFVHGGTMHMVVCRECVRKVSVGGACPMCRMPVEHVVSIVFD